MEQGTGRSQACTDEQSNEHPWKSEIHNDFLMQRRSLRHENGPDFSEGDMDGAVSEPIDGHECNEDGSDNKT
ncbi:hypothetical protein PAENIP36_03700 [Paenibacillus sp. P36]